MTKSESIVNLSSALLKFQSEIKPVIKDASNPYFKSKYADLASILETIRAPLAKEGLSFVQFPSGDGGLTTLLMHTSGEWIEETFSMRAVDSKPQTYGSMITYMRRYALASILGLSTEEDDDGNAASGLGAAKVPTIPQITRDDIPFDSAPAPWQKKVPTRGKKTNESSSEDLGVAIDLSKDD